MSDEADKALARRFFEEMCNGRRLDLAGELLAPGYVYHDPQVPEVRGPEGMAEAVRVYQEGVEGHWGVDDVRATEGGCVVVRWTGTGRHTGTLNGIPPTGKPVSVSALSLLRVADGKIAENWTVWDTLGLLQQIGAIPAAAQPAPA